MENNCGSLIVYETPHSGKMVGIITERDILRACAVDHCALEDQRVRDHMSEKLITGEPDDDVGEVLVYAVTAPASDIGCSS